MRKDIESHNSNDIIGATGKQFLIPSPAQALLYILISALLLLAFNVRALWNYLNNTVLTPQGGLDSFIQSKAPGVHDLFNSLSQSIVLQVLFWLCVGCIIYIFIWFVSNVGVNVINDLVADKYVHPSSYKRSGYWSSVISRKFFFWVSIFITVIFFFAAIKFLSVLGRLCYFEVNDFHLGHSLIVFSEALIVSAFLLHVLILLIHTATNSWRLIYKDL